MYCSNIVKSFCKADLADHVTIEEENYSIVENNNNNKISSDVSAKILKCVIDIAVGIFKCAMNSKKENQEKK